MVVGEISRIDKSYQTKDESYFSHARQDVIDLLPKRCESVLEVGCGMGSTLRLIQSLGICSWIGGVEISKDAASEARKHLDFLVEGDFEKLELDMKPASLDVVLCLDVLEHMNDPWLALERLKKLLKPNGVLITSLPNVKHHSVLLPLIFSDQWQYQDAGIMDKTHLRFFTFKTSVEMLNQAGFSVERVVKKPVVGGGRGRCFVRWLGMTLLPTFCSVQYIIKSVKKS